MVQHYKFGLKHKLNGRTIVWNQLAPDRSTALRLMNEDLATGDHLYVIATVALVNPNPVIEGALA